MNFPIMTRCWAPQVSCANQMPVFPTGSPYIVSVGGSEWKNGDPAQPIAWPGSGGGFANFAAPAHQTAPVKNYLQSTPGLPPASSYNGTNRAFPDISAVATEGTSQSSPTMAGVWSLLMDHRLNQGLPPLGFLAPRIWMAAQKYPGESFQDITEGNTKDTCAGKGCDNGFPATQGWDPVTGGGRPVWGGMLKHFGNDAGIPEY